MYIEPISHRESTRHPPRRPLVLLDQQKPEEKKVWGVSSLLLRCRPFEDEEPERLEPEVDDAPLAVREVAAEAGAHHALPPGAVYRVEL